MGEETRTQTEHIYFEYGRWFRGYGSSMEGHSCARHREDGGKCMTREVTITTVTTATPWAEWKPKSDD
jgi:hypothetical protein